MERRIKNITKKIDSYSKLLIEKREKILSKIESRYIEGYIVKHRQEPSEQEIKRMRKDIMMIAVLIIYVSIIMITFLI